MRTLLVAAATLALATSVEAAGLKRSVELDAAPDEVWQRVGGWCAIADWHPAVESCEANGGERTLTLGGGGTIEERELARGERAYTYAILSSPLPVADYVATLHVEETETGSRLVWQSNFAPAGGASEAEAVETMTGVYDAGLDDVAPMMGE